MMNPTRICKLMAAMVASVCVWSATAGNTCNWKGGSGNLNDPTKWDKMPKNGNGDVLVFDTTDGNPITLFNDLTEDFSVLQVSFTAKTCISGGVLSNPPGTVTLDGNRLYVKSTWFNAASDSNTRGPAVVVNAPMRFNNVQFYQNSAITFNGDIAIDDDGSLVVRWRNNLSDNYNFDVIFNGAIYGPKATFKYDMGNGARGTTGNFYGKVTVDKFYIADPTKAQAIPKLHNAGNEINYLYATYYYIDFMDSGAVGADSTWVLTGGSSSPSYCRLYADNQMRTLTGSLGDSGSYGTATDDKNGRTLTICPTSDDGAQVIFANTLSFVYDPQGDFTYTVKDRTSTTTGSIRVKRGVLAFDGAANFTKVSSVAVEPGAKLDLTTCTAASPLPATVPVTLGYGSKIVIPEGKTLSVGTIIVAGVPVTAGSHAGEDWIQGGGTVSVTTGPAAGSVYWNDANGGNWSDSAKWTPSAPTADTTSVYVMAAGDDDYDVVAGSGYMKFGRVYLGTQMLFPTSTLAHAANAAYGEGTSFTVRQGGVWKQTAGFVAITNNANRVDVENGGVWRVEGGTNLVHSSSNGGLLVPKAGGEILVTGGRLVLENDASYKTPFYLDGGKVALSGTGVLDASNLQNPNWNGGHQHGYGTLELSDSSEAYLASVGYGTTGKRLNYVFKDNASVHVSANVFGGFVFGSDVYFSFGSTNCASSFPPLFFGCNRSSRTEGYVWPGATMPGVSDVYCFIGSYAARAGVVDTATTGLCPTGILTVAGNAFFNGAYFPSTADKATMMTGLAIGATDCEGNGLGPAKRGVPLSRERTWPYGELNVEPTGVFSNFQGMVSIGVGVGEGHLNVRGGRFVKTGAGVTLVGGGMGVGSMRITEGGSVRIPTDGYVGGFDPAEIGRNWQYYPAESLTGTGMVDVVDGILDFTTHSLALGSRGAAFVNVGTNGLIQAGDVTVSNSVATVLTFKAGPEGIGKMKVSGKFTIAPGAKLRLDVSDYTGTKSLKFLTYDSKEGDFAPGDVEIVGNPDMYLSVGSRGMSVSYPGTLILIR